MLHTGIFNRDIALRHGGETDKGTDFDHIGQHPVFGATEISHTFNGQQVAADPADLRPHAVEHPAELLDIGFAGGIINSSGADGHGSGHHDIGGAGNRWFIQQQICAFQVRGFQVKKSVFFMINK